MVVGAADGASITVRASRAGYVFEPAARTVTISDGAATCDFVGRPALGAGISASLLALNQAPATINAGVFTPMLKIRVAAVGGPVTVTGLKLRDTGSAPAVGLDVQVLIGGRAKTLASKLYDAGTKTWTLTFASPNLISWGGYLYFELQEACPATAVGQTCQLSLADAGFVLATAPATGSFPLASTAATVTANAFVAVSGYSLAPATVLTDTWTTLYKALVKAVNGSATLTGLKWRDNGTVAVAALQGRVLSGGQVVPGTLTFDQASRTWTLALSQAKTLAAGAYVYYELQVSAGAGAAGGTVQAQLPDVTAVQADVPAAGLFPLASTAAPVVTPVYLAVTGANVAPATTPCGVWTALCRVRLQATGGAVTVNGLRWQDWGTAPALMTEAQALISGAVAGAVGFDAATRTWTLTLSTPRRLNTGAYLWVELQERAVTGAAGATLAVRMLDPSAVIATAPGVAAYPLASTPAVLGSGDGAETVLIPAGTFTMGSRVGSDEYPQRQVYLSAYRIHKNLVTVAQYRRFCQATGGALPPSPGFTQDDSHPVVDVSWNDANAYAQYCGMSLPTEAQWEKAARGSSDARLYPWGDTWDAGKANTGKDVAPDTWRYTSPVGSFPAGASPYGVLDMAGNVWQWCQDWYRADWYSVMPANDPVNTTSTAYRVLRGGSWGNDGAGNFCVTNRSPINPTYRTSGRGFRCAAAP